MKNKWSLATIKSIFKNTFYCFFSLWTLVACQSPLPSKKTTIPKATSIEKKEIDSPDHRVLNPEFLKNQAPRLGLILGGGGALGFAHIGVLQELEKQKIPVHAIAGLEWGSLIAGAYALKKKAHAIEWKLLKLPIEKFEKKSFFKKSQKSISVSEMDPFLNDLFSKNRFSDLKIPFACPCGDMEKEKVELQKNGFLKKGIRACWPHPPHFTLEKLMGVLTAIPQAAHFLKAQGADIVVYVDVSSSNKLINKDDHSPSWIPLIWIQSKTLVDWTQFSFVDDVIKLSLPGDFINSYKDLRALVRMGQIKSRSQIKKLSKKYSY